MLFTCERDIPRVSLSSMELLDRKRGDYRSYISPLILTSHAYTTAIYLLVTSFRRHRSVKNISCRVHGCANAMMLQWIKHINRIIK